jgi:two-component system OmpR family response regulator
MTSNGRILVIDDNEVMLARVKDALTPAGYDVRTTTRTVGNAGLVRSCDLVLIDYHMPGFNGKAVLDGLREALPADHVCLFYLYTSDPAIGATYGRLGFDGAFTGKGNEASLLRDVQVAFRRIAMRQLKQKKAAGGPRE